MSLVCFCLIAAAPVSFDLWPVPKAIEVTSERGFRIEADTPVIVADDADEEDRAAVALLFDVLGAPLPVLTASQCPADAAGIHVGEPGRNALLDSRPIKRRLADSPAPGPQGYRIRVSRSMIVVAGTDPAGTLYGLQTLAQLIKQSRDLPSMEIRDEPDRAHRGVVVDGPLAPTQMRALAAQRCNRVVFRSDDFAGWTPEQAAAWKAVFAEARRWRIEPIPQVQVLENARALLRQCPAAAEGRGAVDHAVLTGESWQLLANPNVVDTEAFPIRVSVSGQDCRRDADYALDPGLIEAPYSTDNAPWAIRRVADGGIPDGAAVDVTYTYIPADTTNACPAAPETQAFLAKEVAALTATLKPEWILLDTGRLPLLNRDPRCRAVHVSDAELLAQTVSRADKAVKKVNPQAHLVLWADGMNPYQDAPGGSMEMSRALLPKDAAVAVREFGWDVVGRRRIKQSIEWCDQLGVDFWAVTDLDPRSAYAWRGVLQERERQPLGILAMVGKDAVSESDPALRSVLGQAWAAESLRRPWPEGLNDYFEAALWEPKYTEVLDALISHLNRKTLAGASPQHEYADWDAMHAKFLDQWSNENTSDIDLVDRLYRNLTDYLKLEAAFSERQSESVLRQLIKLVQAQAEADPDTDPSRTGQIIATIRDKGLFVPSTILFGPYLLPYRPMKVPPGHVVLEIPATPTYADEEHRVEATWDLLAAPGNICRVDFDTVGTATVELQQSADARTFRPVQKWTSQERGGVRTPILPDRPFAARAIKVTVDAPAEQAILRNPHLFALKAPAVAACAYSATAPLIDASFKESAWPLQPQIDGFVRADAPAFAEAQTTVRLVRTADALFVGVYVREPRMDTLVATLTRRDAPLWQEESFEVIIRPQRGDAFCFVVNPLGTQFDSRGGNVGWDGAWQAATKSYTVGWAAEFAIPFATLGDPPQKGETWDLNCVRTRANVKKECSAWTGHEPGLGAPSACGRVTF